jgi:hypothetical protein
LRVQWAKIFSFRIGWSKLNRGESSSVKKIDILLYLLMIPAKGRPVRSAYQPPASSTFLSEQISHQQPVNSTFSQNKPAPAISH